MRRPIARALPALLLMSAGAPGAGAAGGPGGPGGAGDSGGTGEAAASITEDEIAQHVGYLASPRLEGRDSPSAGLLLAAEYVAGAFAAAELDYAPHSLEPWDRHGAGLVGGDGAGEPPAWSRVPGRASPGTYLRPFLVDSMRTVRRELERPLPAACHLELALEGEPPRQFTFGTDFVPLVRFPGGVRGELVWVGFGIQSRSQRYDDLRGIHLKDKVALFLEGEPRHPRALKGPEVTAESAIWNKLDKLRKAGAAGAIVVRRRPARQAGTREPPAAPPLGFRYTYASFNPPAPDNWRGRGLPGLEVSLECATALLGRDVEELARRLDRTGKPIRIRTRGRRVSFDSASEAGPLTLPNLVGILPGADPDLAGEFVVVGAHMDHIGVGKRGRVGPGADDNASGTACLMELVEALALARPRRSILFAAFSGEEDGLLGSAALVADLPVPRERVVAMINLDMVGRGDPQEIVCLGFVQNPAMGKVVERARKLCGRSGIRKVSPCSDEGLFARSDHYNFHRVGIPVVFFFEHYPLERNKDYHTWRDTPDRVDMEKVTRTARLAFHTTWILATDDDRLPPPRR